MKRSIRTSNLDRLNVSIKGSVTHLRDGWLALAAQHEGMDHEMCLQQAEHYHRIYVKWEEELEGLS